MDKKTCVILGVASFSSSEHDTKTLEATLANVSKMLGSTPETAFCDRGYRGKPAVGTTKIILPSAPKPTDSEDARKEARKDFGRRSAIEPVIGHLKSDFRMRRNYLKGALGDSLNLLLAVAAFNFHKWVVALASMAVFCVKMVSEAIFATFMMERLRHNMA